jgi:uncharacterized protein YdiU (UPF0061 family)
MLREFIISEAMHGLGIPTTRSLAVVTTGEPVFREQPLHGAVLTRVARSHIRVGSFQWAAVTGDEAALAALTDHTMRRHYPEVADPRGLFQAVVERQAALIAKWLHVGFIHGVMNTDNMALSGETIDYGPCAFMDAYDPATVFSSIDRHGRYAYGRQPATAKWNLARLAESLLPLLHADEAQAVAWAREALDGFERAFQRHYLAGMRAKLGLFTEEAEDAALIEGLHTWMHERREDFTNTFVALSTGKPVGDPEWQARFSARLERQPQSRDEANARMRAHNPAFIPRNHNVEEALAAAERGDLQVMHRLLAVLAKPYDYTRDEPEYREPPEPSERRYQTFCGT